MPFFFVVVGFFLLNVSTKILNKNNKVIIITHIFKILQSLLLEFWENHDPLITACW